MVITCPACKGHYRINPGTVKTSVARVKCPECSHVFNVQVAKDDAVPAPTTSGKPVVLVVDDARFFREMIEDILQDLPVELIMAADGNEAWQKINTLAPQLVLLDLNIPGITGKGILQSLQKAPNLGQVKVLVMSGVLRGEEIAAEVRTLGADDFISKSFKPVELQNRVRKLLGL